MKDVENRVEFDGLCPFNACLEMKAHSHTICPACHSIRYDNRHCPHCRTMRFLFNELEIEP